MAVLTTNDYATQIVAQARVLDPSFSGEIGTPERKIIDAVAQALAEAQVDLTGLAGALDIDSKYGSTLDRFTTLFGFQRQQATAATGYVVFSRNSPAPAAVNIPLATLLQSNAPDRQGQFLQFTTTGVGTISEGGTTSDAIPITCTITGSGGNLAANTITQMRGIPVGGVTAVTNPNPLSNGLDGENDNAFKARFKNTWARNLAGTQSQYLAIAVSGAFTTAANVIGAQSRYQEYIQIPDYDDTGLVNSIQTIGETAYGTANQWTTALSSIPYAKVIYGNTAAPAYVQDSNQDFFYRPGTDFVFNSSPVQSGDALRALPTGTLTSQTITSSSTVIHVVSTAGFPSSGQGWMFNPAAPTSPLIFAYTGITSTTFTGVTWINPPVGSVAYSQPYPVYLAPSTTMQPNFTFLNVTGVSNTGIPGLQALSPGNIVLTEFSYVSSASRNDISHAVTNAVDVWVNGSNDQKASCIFLPNNLGNFSGQPNSTWYYENFRRDGSPTTRPHVNNYVTPLFNAPLDSLPPVITINGANYYLGSHYWLVHEIGNHYGSIRARDGIEWAAFLGGDTTGGPPPNPLAPYTTTGDTIATVSSAGTSAIEVDDYLYDANIVTLQANTEAARQITTDALVHRAKPRYFKLDITVMYSPNSNPAAVNASIGVAVQAFFANQYFGAVIQLSDLLDVVHQVPGVDNVRWSDDLPIAPDAIRVLETDISGNPLHGAYVDRIVPGVQTTSTTEVQRLYVVGGQPTNPAFATSPYNAFGATDSFTLTFHPLSAPPVTTAPILFSTLTASTIQTAIQTALVGAGFSSGPLFGVTVAADTRSTINVVNPISSFTITYGAAGAPYIPSVDNTITQSAYAYDSDFFLLDDELPNVPNGAATGDTVPGLIIRTRAQNTWLRTGLG